MKSPVPIAAIAGSLLLHGTVIAIAVSVLSSPPEEPAERRPFVAEFVITPPAAASVPAVSSPTRTAPPQPRAVHAPMPRPEATTAHETAAVPGMATDPPRDSPPVAATAAPTIPAAVILPAPTSTAPVARTGVSISANYEASNRKPVYPTLSKRYGEQGTVMLRVFVQADGSAGKIEIRDSSGYPLLDEAAQAAVKAWRFIPATVDGKAIAEWYQVPIPFTLQN